MTAALVISDSICFNLEGVRKTQVRSKGDVVDLPADLFDHFSALGCVEKVAGGKAKPAEVEHVEEPAPVDEAPAADEAPAETAAPKRRPRAK
jgi:hypothetical protein